MTKFNIRTVLECLRLGYDQAVILKQGSRPGEEGTTVAVTARLVGVTRTNVFCKVENCDTGRTDIKTFPYGQIHDLRHWQTRESAPDDLDEEIPFPAEHTTPEPIEIDEY